MKKAKIYRQRLEKLAKHLESGKLGHANFNFSTYNSLAHSNKPCGTSGCALGECPIIWPKSWNFSENNSFIPSLAKENLETTCGYQKAELSAEKWFGLERQEILHLFYAGHQRVKSFGGEVLNDHATKEQVAANIRAFLVKIEGT